MHEKLSLEFADAVNGVGTASKKERRYS